MNINKNFIGGNLTRDPETRYLPSGVAICEFSIAHNERRKKGEQWVDVAHFFDCKAWGPMGEACGNHLTKGSRVMIEGRLSQERWDDKEGKKRSKVVIVCDKVIFMDRKGDEMDQRPPPAHEPENAREKEPPMTSASSADDDNLPF